MKRADMLHQRWQAGLGEVFSAAETLAATAQGAASLLQSLVPEAALAACRLEGPQGPVVRLARAGDDFPAFLAFLGRLNANVEESEESPVPHLTLRHAAASFRGKLLGMLVLGFSGSLPKKTADARSSILALAAGELALHLVWDKREKEVRALRQEQEEAADLVLAGQAVAGLAHDFANHLNTMVLQASCLQLKADEALREELALIRREGARAAGLLRPLQKISEERRKRCGVTDLLSLVGEALPAEELSRTQTEIATGLPLPIAPGDCRRMLREIAQFLASSEGGTNRLKTGSTEHTVFLAVDLPGIPFREGGIAELFAAVAEPDESRRTLRRVAFESMLRQSGAQATTGPGPGGGTSLEISWCEANRT
jgi:signal transduction histidine kinase